MADLTATSLAASSSQDAPTTSMELGNSATADMVADAADTLPAPDAMALDRNNDTTTADAAPALTSDANGTHDEAPALETRIPAKKDATLREFLSKMDDYAPIVRIALSDLNADMAQPKRVVNKSTPSH